MIIHVLPSYQKVVAELTDAELEDLLLAGEEESTPGYLLVLLAEWDRRNGTKDAA